MTLPTVIAVGSVAVSVQLRAARWPEPGETLVAREFSMLSGGSAAIVAHVARRLGAKARLVARAGYDVFGHQALEPLAADGVELAYVERVATAPTGVTVVRVDQDGAHSVLMADNANATWRDEDERHIADALATTARPAAVVIDVGIPARVAACAAELARARAYPAILIPCPADRVDDELLAGVDFVVASAAAAERLSDTRVDSPESAVRAAHAVLARGAGAVVVRLHGGDCVCVDRLGHDVIRTPRAGVRRPPGTGAAFAGAMAVALLEGRDPVAATRFAAAASAIATTPDGAQPAYPRRAEVDRLLDQNR